MGTAYYDPRSVHMRLDRTVCMYKGLPMYVECIRHPGEDNPPPRMMRATAILEATTTAPAPTTPANPDDFHMLRAYRLDNLRAKPITVDYREPDFDYRAFPLGYLNMIRSAWYLARIPSRNQKQGLCRNQISGAPNSLNYFTSPEFEKCILGEYPSPKEALEKVNNMEVESIAFDRNFAFKVRSTGGHGLLYKGRRIGYILKSGRIRLIESMEEDVMRRIIRDKFKDSDICLATS